MINDLFNLSDSAILLNTCTCFFIISILEKTWHVMLFKGHGKFWKTGWLKTDFKQVDMLTLEISGGIAIRKNIGRQSGLF